MNINEIKVPFTKREDNRGFYMKLAKDSPEVFDAVALCQEDYLIREQEVETFLNKKYGKNSGYSCGYRQWSGNTCTYVQLFDRTYIGIMVLIDYKGLTFMFEALKDGEINRPYLAYWLFNGPCSHQELPMCNTFEEYYQEALKIVNHDKRQIMNHYNKLIKDTKANYRERLAKVNAILKQH